jgi:hypothetical protein
MHLNGLEAEYRTRQQVQHCRFACSCAAEEHGAIASFAADSAHPVLLEQTAKSFQVYRRPAHLHTGLQVSTCGSTTGSAGHRGSEF